MRAVLSSSVTWADALIGQVSAPCKRHHALASFTTFRIGGPADVLAEPATEEQLAELIRACNQLGVAITLLGGGSNVLVGDGGIRGCVVKLGGSLASVVPEDGGRTVRAGAGAAFPVLTRMCMGLGWPGSNGWVGTPGTVGGALIMNAGSREGELGDVVKSVRLYLEDNIVELDRAACGFAYRTSGFPRGGILLSTVLHCPQADPDQAVAIQDQGKGSLSRRKQTQPRQHSAGSIFKNPPGQFAGKLIEDAGLKGTTCGGACISEVHANFIVNTGGATAKDVVTLATRAQQVVLEKTGVTLEWEVRRLGEFT